MTIEGYIEALKKAKVGEQIIEQEQLRKEGKLHPSDDCHTHDHYGAEHRENRRKSNEGENV